MRRTIAAALALASALAALRPRPPRRRGRRRGAVPGPAGDNPFTTAISLGNADRGALGFTSTVPPATGCTQIASVAGVGRGAPGRARSLKPYDLAAPPVAYANTRAILVQRRTLDATCRR